MGVHLASPGMVATDLLLAGPHGATAARAINVLAEDAAAVAAWLVPRMRGACGSGKYFRCAATPAWVECMQGGYAPGS